MRLLFVSQDFPPARGGIQTYAGELAARFALRADDFAVLAPEHPDAVRHDEGLSFPVHRVRASADLFPLLSVPRVVRLVREQGFDAVFATQWSSALPVQLAGRRVGPVQLFVAAHGREVLFEPGRLPALIRRTYAGLRRKVYLRADHIFPVSRFTAGLLHQNGVHTGRTTVIPNGADPVRFSPGDASALRQHLALNGHRVLISVCRLVPRKGIDTTLRALPAVLRQVPHVRYLVVGDGPDRARLEALACTLGVDAHVQFIPGIDNEALPAYYNLAEAVVMPSRSDPPDVEGFGIVFLEANACEKPVVGADAGGIPDAILHGETGLLIPPDDPEALAASIIQLLNEPEFALRLGRQGRARVVREATWDTVASRMFEAMSRSRAANILRTS